MAGIILAKRYERSCNLLLGKPTYLTMLCTWWRNMPTIWRILWVKGLLSLLRRKRRQTPCWTEYYRGKVFWADCSCHWKCQRLYICKISLLRISIEKEDLVWTTSFDNIKMVVNSCKGQRVQPLPLHSLLLKNLFRRHGRFAYYLCCLSCVRQKLNHLQLSQITVVCRYSCAALLK